MSRRNRGASVGRRPAGPDVCCERGYRKAMAGLAVQGLQGCWEIEHSGCGPEAEPHWMASPYSLPLPLQPLPPAASFQYLC